MITRQSLGSRLGVGLLMLVLIFSIAPTPRAAAVAQMIQTKSATTDGGTSVSATFTAVAKTNHLLIAVCASRNNGLTTTNITGPSGFTSAKSEANATSSEAIFYKVSVGTEQAISCTLSTSVRCGIHIYEYSGMATTSPLDAVNTTTSTGTSISPASGSVTTTNANDLLFATIVTNANTSISAWNSSFTLRNNFVNGSTTTSRATYSGADRAVSATGTYSSVATAGASGAWRGQIAAFKALPITLSSDVVDGSGVSVASPSAGMTSASSSFSCQAVTGTLGTATQKVRINNTTSNPAWTVSIAATSGPSALWTTGSTTYDFNDPSGSGCTNGQLTIDPSAGTLTPAAGCANTGLTLGSSAGFSSGVTDSITLATGSASATINCYWDLTGVSLSQQVPAERAAGAYSLNLTITTTAN